jgi:hypothetical protein
VEDGAIVTTDRREAQQVAPDAYVAKIVESFPPLSPEQIQKVTTLLREG